MRIFIALELPEKEYEEIARKKSKIQNLLSDDINWVKNENLHMTSVFLGNIDKRALEKLNKILKFLSQRFKTFTLKNPEIEIFPFKSPKLIWIRFKEEDNELYKFTRVLKELLISNGFKIDNNDFIPHITLGRVKSRISNSTRKIIDKEVIKITKTELKKVTIFHSLLQKEGPVYKRLSVFEMN